jgi:subtilisin
MKLASNRGGWGSRRAAARWGLGALLALFGLTAVLVPAEGHERDPIPVPGQYIVVLKEKAGDAIAAASAVSRRHGCGLVDVYDHAIKGFVATVPPGRLRDIAADPNVQYVEQDQVVFADAQTLPTGINRIEADLSSTQSGNGSGAVSTVAVAVIDTGILRNHSDLNVVGGINFTSNDPTKWNDGNGHGTHVAGTIGALDNGFGVVGVAPGVPLWAVRVLNNAGSGTWSGVIAGINWVVANAASRNIRVANMSLGGGFSQAVNDAVTNAVNSGIVFCVAAGNESTDASTTSPASCQAAITVAALADSDGKPGGLGSLTPYGADDTFASFSNFGAVVDVIAPGVNILSTWKSGSYATLSGTSMATPHVTGAAALYLSQNPTATPDAVLTALTSAAVEQVPGPGGLNYPLVNVQSF